MIQQDIVKVKFLELELRINSTSLDPPESLKDRSSRPRKQIFPIYR